MTRTRSSTVGVTTRGKRNHTPGARTSPARSRSRSRATAKAKRVKIDAKSPPELPPLDKLKAPPLEDIKVDEDEVFPPDEPEVEADVRLDLEDFKIPAVAVAAAKVSSPLYGLKSPPENICLGPKSQAVQKLLDSGDAKFKAIDMEHSRKLSSHQRGDTFTFKAEDESRGHDAEAGFMNVMLSSGVYQRARALGADVASFLNFKVGASAKAPSIAPPASILPTATDSAATIMSTPQQTSSRLDHPPPVLPKQQVKSWQFKTEDMFLSQFNPSLDDHVQPQPLTRRIWSYGDGNKHEYVDVPIPHPYLR